MFTFIYFFVLDSVIITWRKNDRISPIPLFDFLEGGEGILMLDLLLSEIYIMFFLRLAIIKSLRKIT